MRAAVLTTVIATLATVGNADADRQLWLEAGMSLPAAKRLELDLTSQLRFDQDVSRFAAFLPELSARYRVTRWLRAGGGYRFEYERDNNGDLVVRHRIATEASVRKDFGDVRFDDRLMIFEQVRPSSKNSLRTFIRNRVNISYRGIRPWVPFASAELFFLLDDLDQFAYHRTRLTAGTVFGRGDHDVEVFVRAELHADPQDPTFYILGLGYHYR